MTRKHCKFVVTFEASALYWDDYTRQKSEHTLGMKSAAILRVVGVFIFFFLLLWIFLFCSNSSCTPMWTNHIIQTMVCDLLLCNKR